MIVSRRAGTFVAALLYLSSLALSSGAQAHIYWSTGSSIGRANLDGTGVDQSFISDTCGSSGLAVDTRYVYWSNAQCHSIGRANVDGTGADQNFITGLDLAGGYVAQPGGLALTAAYLYWYMAGFEPNSVSGGSSIGRANIDGSGVQEQWRIGGFLAPEGQGIAVDSAHLYWTSTWTISRANLDGSAADNQFIVYPGGFLPLHIAVDSAHIYWTSMFDSSIGRANLDGTNVNWDFISGAGAPVGLAVGNGHIYWTNGTRIGRANLDGTGVDLNFITGVSANAALALDPPHVPDYMIFSCDPQGVASWGSSKCIADVLDQGGEGIPATGTVTITASAGTLSASTCTLNQYAYCGVDWYPPADAIPGNWYPIYARYSGDSTFLPGDFPYPAWLQIVVATGSGPQMPVLRSQCKDGYWQLYRASDGEQIFKNQGDCVSYVAVPH